MRDVIPKQDGSSFILFDFATDVFREIYCVNCRKGFNDLDSLQLHLHRMHDIQFSHNKAQNKGKYCLFLFGIIIGFLSIAC